MLGDEAIVSWTARRPSSTNDASSSLPGRDDVGLVVVVIVVQ
jgi:hypothetical protein